MIVPSMYLTKTRALTSYAVTVQLICAYVFAYAKCRFCHDLAHIVFLDHMLHVLSGGSDKKGTC